MGLNGFTPHDCQGQQVGFELHQVGQPSFGRVLLGVILLGVQVVADLAALLTVRPLEGQGTDTPKVHDFQLAPVQLPAELNKRSGRR